MPDTAAVDTALLAKLGADATLTTLMPGGIWFDVGPHGVEKFVLVAQLAHEDHYLFGGSAWEVITYLIKAVALSTSVTDAKAAASRIHTLLQDGTLTPTGYGLMRMQRAERVRFTEVDQQTDARWQHSGAHYEVWVQPS